MVDVLRAAVAVGAAARVGWKMRGREPTTPLHLNDGRASKKESGVLLWPNPLVAPCFVGMAAAVVVAQATVLIVLIVLIVLMCLSTATGL